MPVYEDLKDRLEDMLENCLDDKIKPGDIDAIKDVVETIYKLNGILMAEEYGNYGDNMPMNTQNGSYSTGNGYRGRNYGARRRDSRGRYMRRYGHDKEDMIRDLEMKMADLSGEDQDVMRRAINIIERG